MVIPFAFHVGKKGHCDIDDHFKVWITNSFIFDLVSFFTFTSKSWKTACSNTILEHLNIWTLLILPTCYYTHIYHHKAIMCYQLKVKILCAIYQNWIKTSIFHAWLLKSKYFVLYTKNWIKQAFLMAWIERCIYRPGFYVGVTISIRVWKLKKLHLQTHFDFIITHRDTMCLSHTFFMYIVSSTLF